MKNPTQELSEIKSMMEKSTRFLSLSGIAGIPVGIIALTGITAINYTINQSFGNWNFPNSTSLDQTQILATLIIALSIFLLALGTTWYLSQRKAVKAKKTSINTPASRRFIKTLAFSILIGALTCISMAWNMDFSYIPGLSLIFYGIGMHQASQHTFKELKLLGLGCIISGILALMAPSLGLIFWGLGFGLLHILYGVMMYQKYDK